MNSPLTYPARIRRLLQTHTVMTVDQLRQALDGRSRSSVFRDLKQLQVITSYSHAGRYHALQGAARFDPHGLWFFNDIGFARYGTLKATLVQLIAQAQDGFTHKELKSRLRVAVQNALTDLVMSHTVGRRALPNGRALYISAHDAQGEAQWRRRVSRVECAAETALPSQHTRIEILVELIRARPARGDEQVLGAALRARGIAVDDREVMAVLHYYDIKKTAYEIAGVLRAQVDSLCGRLAPRVLFSQRPRLHFCPSAAVCECGGAMRVSKTRTKSVSTLVIGQFEALETQRYCPRCGAHDRCDELRSLTPHRGQFGFDVIEWVGRALFVEGRNERAVQAELAARNIPISTSEVGFLGKRFIVYLALAHRACQGALREHLCAKGGYILHLDATCEGDSPQLFSAMDELSRMVLGNRKMPSEDSQHMIPLLEELKAAYGVPLALVHDMGSAILKAAATVFPTVPSFICHFHFLRDLGKDLFGFEYRTIYRYTRAFKTKATLRRTAKSLRAVVDHEAHLRDQMHTYLRDKQALHERAELNPWLTAYLLVVWVLEAGSACEGFGFPFDRAHLLFYQRLREAYPALKQLQAEGVTGLPVAALQRVVRDAALSRLVTRIEQKITHFDQLRNVMRIARPDSGQGLNDEGDGEVRTVAKGVQAFRESQTITALSESDLSYRKMVKQIDKYWEKLFADPIAVDTPAGRVMIQPQRTNNLMEQSFRFLKRDGRKKTGHKVLSRTLVAMLADTPLVRNLDNPDYLRILLQGKLTLAERFADIDIQQVRQHEHESSRQFRKYPKHMRRLLRVPHLPRKLVKTAAA